MSLSCSRYLHSLAIKTRMLIFVTQVVSNLLIPDHSADVFNPPPDLKDNKLLDAYILPLISGFRRWDAIYYMHIAQHGYTYENCLVFFPFFPGLLWILANTILLPLQLVTSYYTVLLLGGVFLNNFLFILTVSVFYRLGLKVTNNHDVAFLATVLFCINPASIFMSAPYTETLFLFCTFLGMLQCEEQRFYIASLCFSLSCLTRSNGLTLLGYFGYSEWKHIIFLVSSHVKKDSYKIRDLIKNALFVSIPRFFVCAAISIIPFLCYQYYSFALYCSDSWKLNINSEIYTYGKTRGYVVQGHTDKSSWCNSLLPLSYSYVQKHHWGLGFLSYFEVRQIPNFLLALPVIVFSLMAIRRYCEENSYLCHILGFTEDKPGKDIGYGNNRHFPYVVHLMFLTMFGILFMHIQVLTRLLFSSCPTLYWFIAAEILKDRQQKTEHNAKDRNKKKINPKIFDFHTELMHSSITDIVQEFKDHRRLVKLILVYFLAYFFIGIIMFSNFLPWT